MQDLFVSDLARAGFLQDWCCGFSACLTLEWCCFLETKDIINIVLKIGIIIMLCYFCFVYIPNAQKLAGVSVMYCETKTDCRGNSTSTCNVDTICYVNLNYSAIATCNLFMRTWDIPEINISQIPKNCS